MSFAGSSAPSSSVAGGTQNDNGNPTFTRSQITGQTRSFAGGLSPQEILRRKLAFTDIKQPLEDLKKAQKLEDLGITEEEYDEIIDEIINVLPELTNEQEQTIQDYMSRIQYIQLIKEYQDLLSQDFYYNALEEYGISPSDDAVKSQLNVKEVQKQLTDELLANMNEVFDGLGKAGISGVEELGESLTDFARAIADKNPEFAVEAVLEVLGVEFQDGEFDLRATIMDNVRPIFQKLMARYVINPAKNYIKSLGFSSAEAEAMETQLLEDVEASTATIESELQAIAETEVNPLIGILIGGSQALSAVSRAVAGVVQAINMSHDAYTMGNHKWFTDGNKFEWVRKIPLIGDLADGIASLVEEAEDARDYKKGQTDRQRYERALADYNKIQRDYNLLIRGILDGDVDMNKLQKGETITLNRNISVLGLTTQIPVNIDVGNLATNRIDNTIHHQQLITAQDALEELNNLEDFYTGELEKFDNDQAFQRLTRGQLATGGRTGFDPRVAAQLGLSQEQALALVRNYDEIRATLFEINQQQDQYETLEREVQQELNKELFRRMKKKLGFE